MLENKPEKIILGCTHYPYLLNVLTQFAPKDLFIDPSVTFANFIKEDLEKNNMLKKSSNVGTDEFFVSANPKHFMDAASIFYPVKTLPTLI
ncbi:Glutamate racemase [bioreactor metagenome]|uniref:Glutamate racemase n=1 Tax=bioreactor metagenome TaxID=1076179 RepID=A0A645IR19_9ZZZZ